MIQPVVKLVVTPTTGLTTGCIVYTAGCKTGCTTRFDNRLNEQRLFVQHGCQSGCQIGLTTGGRVNGVLETRIASPKLHSTEEAQLLQRDHAILRLI